MNNNSFFKDEVNYERRVFESQRLRNKYPNHIPVIIERKDDKIEDIDKKKYLVPYDITIAQFIVVIRKRINLDKTKALFVFCNNVLPSNSALITNIYMNNKDEDGFLYFKYTAESTFG